MTRSTMTSPNINQIWTRWLDQSALDESQARVLAAALTDDGKLADELLEDLDMVRQLSALGQSPTSDAGFVAATLSQFDQQVAAVEKSPSDDSVAVDQQPFGWLDAAKNEAAPMPLAEPVDSPELPSIKTRERRRQKSPRSQRVWIGILVAVPLMIGLAFLIWPGGERAQPQHPPVAEKEPGNENGAPRVDEPIARIPESEPLVPAEPDLPKTHEPPVESLVDDNSRANRDQKVALDWNRRVVPESEKDLARPVTPLQPGMPGQPVFASVQERGRCLWRAAVPESGRVGVGELTLITGRADIEFDNGQLFRMVAPATVRLDGPDQLTLIEGKLQGNSFEAETDEFVIRTVNARVQPQTDSRFSMEIEPIGDQLTVDRGAIDVVPWYGNATDDSILLSPSGLDNAMIQDIDDQHGGPIQAYFRNNRGAYEGWVNVEGQVLKSQNMEFVNEIYLHARDRYMDSPQDLRREWNNLLSLVRSGQNMGGQPNIGQQLTGTEFDQFMDRFSGVLNQAIDPAQARFFQGTFEFNGRQMQFNSPQEFAAAREEILGSFAEVFDHFQNRNKR